MWAGTRVIWGNFGYLILCQSYHAKLLFQFVSPCRGSRRPHLAIYLSFRSVLHVAVGEDLRYDEIAHGYVQRSPHPPPTILFPLDSFSAGIRS